MDTFLGNCGGDAGGSGITRQNNSNCSMFPIMQMFPSWRMVTHSRLMMTMMTMNIVYTSSRVEVLTSWMSSMMMMVMAVVQVEPYVLLYHQHGVALIFV
jgi:hypothetical protein